MTTRTKSLFRKNFAITFGIRILSFVLQVVRSIIAARALGPGGRGILSVVYTTVQTLQRTTELGVSAANVYFLGKGRYRDGELFVNSLLSAVVLGGGAGALFFVWLHFYPTALGYIPHHYFYIAVGMLPLALWAQYNTTIFQGKKQFLIFNVLKILEPLVFFIVFVALVEVVRMGVPGAVYANAVAVAVYCLVSTVLVLRIKGFRLHFKRGMFRAACGFGLRSHLGNIGWFLGNRFDIFLVNFFTDIEYVGFYAVSAVVAESILYIPNSLAPVMFPIVASNAKQDVHDFTAVISRNSLFICSLAALFLFAAAGVLIPLAFGQEFALSVMPARILLPGIVALSITRIISSYLIGIGRPLLPSAINWVMLFINIVNNLIMIPKWGIAGAALASTVSYGIGMMMSVFVFAEIGKIPLRDVLFVKPRDLEYYRDTLARLLKK